MQAEPVFIDDPHPARASASSAAYSISSSRRDQHNKYRQADAELVDVNRSPDHRTHSLRWTTTTSNSCRSMTSGALAFMACRASPIASMLCDSALTRDTVDPGLQSALRRLGWFGECRRVADRCRIGQHEIGIGPTRFDCDVDVAADPHPVRSPTVAQPRAFLRQCSRCP